MLRIGDDGHEGNEQDETDPLHERAQEDEEARPDARGSGKGGKVAQEPPEDVYGRGGNEVRRPNRSDVSPPTTSTSPSRTQTWAANPS